ncbi:fumarylacetoacetate hydrolase family protein [Ramlibacter sp.]|uniref:fumarylacetoacetate hydrolase family protein n=1 Tax=Ramlibacter sp. TaxID=1917967 RepID=UPI003D0B5711
MKLISFRRSGSASRDEWGVLADDGIVVLSDAWPRLQDALATGLPAIAESAKRSGAARVALADVQLLLPVTQPGKIVCVGLNYRSHIAEAGRKESPYPSLFMRHIGSFVGHGGQMVRPFLSEHFDFEAELALVIGKRGRHVAEADAREHIAGYTCAQENSVRDFQKHGPQVTPGKNFDNSGVLGPWIVTADEMPPLDQVRVVGRLNGEQMQDGAVADLIFTVPYLVSYISSFMTLEPGDIILTGTPEGVGSARKPQLWMKAGDTYEVEITGIGKLAATVVDEPRESART